MNLGGERERDKRTQFSHHRVPPHIFSSPNVKSVLIRHCLEVSLLPLLLPLGKMVFPQVSPSCLVTQQVNVLYFQHSFLMDLYSL